MRAIVITCALSLLLVPAAQAQQLPSVSPQLLSAPPAPPAIPTGHSNQPDPGPDGGQRQMENDTHKASTASYAHDAGLEGDEPTPGGAANTDYCELENALTLEIGTAATAGSAVASVQLTIGTFVVNLLAPGGGFAPGQILRYDFNTSSCPSCWNSMVPDDWDKLVLSTTSGDGIFVDHLTLVHSDMLVLDVETDAWLDRYYGAKLDVSIDTATDRFDAVGSRVTALHYASQELGQTGYEKYYSGGDIAWCSEFAAWAIRQNGLSTPTGSIGVADLDSYFSGLGRMYTKADVEAGAYMPKAGDYIAVNGRTHSVLFVEWTSAVGAVPTNSDTFLTIEGNTCNAVRMKERSWSTIDFVGNAQ